MLRYLLVVIVFSIPSVFNLHPLAHYDIIAFQCLFRLNNPFYFAPLPSTQSKCSFYSGLQSQLRSECVHVHLHSLPGKLHFFF